MMTLSEFLHQRGVYSDDVYGDYQKYIETMQHKILGESKESINFRRGYLMKLLAIALCFATVLYWEPAVASQCCDGGFIRGEDKEP